MKTQRALQKARHRKISTYISFALCALVTGTALALDFSGGRISPGILGIVMGVFLSVGVLSWGSSSRWKEFAASLEEEPSRELPLD